MNKLAVGLGVALVAVSFAGLAAAHPGQTVAVVIGTTLGMMLANVPVVYLGGRFAEYVNLARARFWAATLFAAFGVWVLWKGV